MGDVLERGHLYFFFYRRRVDEDAAKSLDDVGASGRAARQWQLG
jgi:hypothetical protein